MTGALALLGCVGEAGLIYAAMILLQLSRKLGEVTKTPPYYRGYYIAIALLAGALIIQLLTLTAAFPPAQLDATGGPYILVHNVLLAIGLTISLALSWKYWGWLIYER